MRFVKVSDDSTRAELQEAIGFLRAKRAACCLADLRDEIDAAIDALIEMWGRASA